MAITINTDIVQNRILDIEGHVIGFSRPDPTVVITATGIDDCKRLEELIKPLFKPPCRAIIKRPCTAIELHRDSARA